MAIELKHDTFAGRIGETFILSGHGVPGLTLTLNEVVDLSRPDRKLPPQVRQDPFHLTFCGPREPVLNQGMYTLTHETLGPIELFVVPCGFEGDHLMYNVTIN